MRELILIRHGQSTANADGIWQGQLDYPLSEAGREQARYAGDALYGEEISSFYASPLSRAFETASIIARACGFSGRIEPVPGLTERGGGLFEGNTWAERERDMPEVLERFRAAGEEAGWEIVGAETDAEILTRFDGAMEYILAEPQTGARTVVVSHGGILRAFLRARFGDGVLAGGERIGNTAITRLTVGDEGEMELVVLADSGHIPDEAKTTPGQVGPASE